MSVESMVTLENDEWELFIKGLEKPHTKEELEFLEKALAGDYLGIMEPKWRTKKDDARYSNNSKDQIECPNCKHIIKKTDI